MNQDEAWVQYTEYLKPLTGKLLRFLKLDKSYRDGRGNWLFYQDAEGNMRRVLDATGGYGANLLGHKHPEIMDAIPALLAALPPNHLQGSVSEWSAMLASELSNRLSAETGAGPWVCTLANSGAEAVEAALKYALLHHKECVKKKILALNCHFNSLRKQLENQERGKRSCLLSDIKRAFNEFRLPESLSRDLCQAQTIDQVVDRLDRYNKKTLSAPPVFLSVAGGFHGKTLGALMVTSNPVFRNPFFLDNQNIRTRFIERNDLADIQIALNDVRSVIYFMEMKNGIPSISIKEINKIAACILEPIQGEGGIHLLEKGFVKTLREEADRRGFLLIFDEIQAGLYRTGLLSSGSHLGIGADLYCFSKALGGGFAKISALLAKKNKYIEKFGYLHSSTFSEDAFSSAIASRVLKLLQPSTVGNGMKVAELLQRKLFDLQERFPAVIKEIRGRGFLIGVEFQPTTRNTCYEFKFFCDLRLLGYLFSSALLHHAHLRISPALSSPLTLRLELSLFTTDSEIEHICKGLEGLCQAVARLDMTFFFGHLFPGYRIGPAHRIPEGIIKYEKGSRQASVFLSHVIHSEDTKKIFHALQNVPSDVIEQNFKDIFELVEFEVYFSGHLKGTNGAEVDTVVLSLPVPSAVIHDLYKSDRSHLLAEKIQNAVRYAGELGANTVGLGQFTSIVTKNGLALDPQGMNLTTGNAYTVALMIEAGLRLAEEKKIQLRHAHIGFVGAAGNVVSIAASIFANYCCKVSLFYHTPVERSKKLCQMLMGFLQDITRSRSKKGCTQTLAELLRCQVPAGPKDLAGFLRRPEVQDVLKVETDLQHLRHCDLVMTGTNSSKTLIEPGFLKKNAVIIDAGVPGDVPARLVKLRPDISVIKGGIARMPQTDRKPCAIVLPSFPLQEGQAFACMSETFSIGLSPGEKVYHVGSLSKEVVERAKGIADSVGFQLSHYKEIKTFDF
jgi:acetylornithine/succinyldiaminopimelate/putrescine aminotransferase/predicted amino acid dehydrogenase